MLFKKSYINQPVDELISNSVRVSVTVIIPDILFLPKFKVNTKRGNLKNFEEANVKQLQYPTTEKNE